MKRTELFNWSRGRHGRRFQTLLPVVFLLSLAGCSASDGLYPVTGQVTYQGKPLEHGSIVFVSPKSRQITGDIERGEIVRVSTTNADDGIAAGEYMVGITSRDQSEKYKNSMAPPSIIPIRYADASTSGLKATIQPNTKNVLRYELE
jgi:hypothetical protein